MSSKAFLAFTLAAMSLNAVAQQAQKIEPIPPYKSHLDQLNLDTPNLDGESIRMYDKSEVFTREFLSKRMTWNVLSMESSLSVMLLFPDLDASQRSVVERQVKALRPSSRRKWVSFAMSARVPEYFSDDQTGEMLLKRDTLEDFEIKHDKTVLPREDKSFTQEYARAILNAMAAEGIKRSIFTSSNLAGTLKHAQTKNAKDNLLNIINGYAELVKASPDVQGRDALRTSAIKVLSTGMTEEAAIHRYDTKLSNELFAAGQTNSLLMESIAKEPKKK